MGVAVSGGSDSTALLHLAAEWAGAAGARLVAATVDHGLRAAAEAEAEAVGDLCRSLGVEHAVLEWRGWDGAGNVQAEARAARYRLLAEWGARARLDYVLLGHTMDDQAETFLMRLARRAGVDGLAAMAARFNRNGQAFGRPLLGQRREELRDALRARGVGWIDDPSNEDARFDRVKTRAVLGGLADIGIDAHALSTVSENMADVRAALDWQVAQIAAQAVEIEAGDLRIDLAALAAVPEEIARRLIVAALLWVAGGAYAPRRAPVQRMLVDLREGRGGTLAGCVLTVRHGAVRVAREPAAVSDIQSTGPVWDGRWQVEGPWQGGEILRALGEEGLGQIKDWRAAGVPRQSLLASPSVWREGQLIGAPLAGYGEGWQARLCADRAGFPLRRH
ncbi:MAG: tRNA lysidine(34) synthetase TilS [Rhodobacteraceae bacterium]|nr:tRNA lysidine(34) synthetase TilS [Paracoccaceae bacterium]